MYVRIIHVSSLQISEFSLFVFVYSRTVKHADAGLKHVARSGVNIYGVSLSQYLMTTKECDICCGPGCQIGFRIWSATILSLTGLACRIPGLYL